MPNFNIVPDTAAAHDAVAPLDVAVNDILKRLKDISARAEEISDCLSMACSAAEGALEVLKDHRKSLSDQLLEIQIAATTP